MKVRVDEIKDKGLVLEDNETFEHFPSLAEMQEAGECNFVSPIHSTLEIKKEYGHIRVEGHVSALARVSCSNCLADFDYTVDSRFTIFYTKNAGTAVDEEVELSEEDLVASTYSGDEIDFTNEIAEQVMLDIPIKPICREGCRGLCSNCGADLNAGECGCDRSPFNVKFSALKDIKIDR